MKNKDKDTLVANSTTFTPPDSPTDSVDVVKEARRKMILASYKKVVNENGKALEMLSKH